MPGRRPLTQRKGREYDLLLLADEPAREELRRLGWVMCPMPGGTMWRAPSGFLFSEFEAIVQLNDPSRRVSE